MQSSILLVDDDADLCWVLSRVLGRAGYAARSAHNGADALVIARRCPPRLVLMDYRLPDTDGIALFARMREQQPRLAALLMTSYPTPAILASAESDGFSGTLTKPIGARNLLDRVHEAMAWDSANLEALSMGEGSEGSSVRFPMPGLLHDLGNPLHCAVSSLQFLQTKLEEEASPHLDMVNVVLRSLNRMDRLLRGLATAAKCSVSAELQRVDLRVVIADAVKLMAPDCRKQNVTVTCPSPDTPLPVECNPDAATRLLLNLMRNSLEAMDGTGVLEIGATQLKDSDRNWTSLKVSDTGPGLSPSLQAQVGSPFVSSKGEGRGLGLYLCRQVLAVCGGSMNVTNRASGGAQVEIRFRNSGGEVRP